MIFDLIMSQYGLTFKQIGEMTYKEVFIAYTSIIKRKKLEMKFIAGCLGATFEDDKKKDEVDEHDQKHLDSKVDLMAKASEEAMMRKGLKRRA